MRSLRIIALAALPLFGMSQKMKVQTAWRALNDYESTLNEGKPDVAYLNKAKEAIDIALTNEDTKNQGKTWAYKARIHYSLYKYALLQEDKKLEATVADKKERIDLAYGNTPTTEFETANDAVTKLKDVDPKYVTTIQDGFLGKTQLVEDDLKFMVAMGQMKMEAGNIAAGKYKAKQYDLAADYFYKLAYLNMQLSMKKDTANFYNACVAAGKSKIPAKILEYNKKMVDLKISSPYNFQSMYNANLSKGDTTAALEILKKGRATFPQDMDLLNTETNIFLAKGKQQEAIGNLSASIEKDPSNALFYLVRGNIYDNMANPKDAATGKDKDKPANFDELFGKAESDYKKVIELNPSNKEHLYNSLYNLGAMYNNLGGYFQTKASNLPLTEAKTKGKEFETKSQDNYKKAIPHLEQALTIKPEDKATMSALRKLYMLTNDQAKATEMNNRMKGK